MIECAILIPSTDRFADVWGPALECLKRYWPDRPWPLFTTSETLPWGESHVQVGTHRSIWHTAVRYALDYINAEFVLLFLEDMLVCEPVNTMKCLTTLELMQITPNLGGVLLGPGPQYSERVHNSYFKRIAKGESYRISTSPTLWRSDYLKKLLGCGENPWQFEIQGSVHSESLPEEVWRCGEINEYPHVVEVLYTAVTRGEAEFGAIEWLKRIGVEWIPNRPIKGKTQEQRWPQ